MALENKNTALDKHKTGKRKINLFLMYFLLSLVCIIIIYFYADTEVLSSNTDLVDQKRQVVSLSAGGAMSKERSYISDSSPKRPTTHQQVTHHVLEDKPAFSMRKFFTNNRGKSLSQGLLDEISKGRLEVNQSLKKGDEHYTALFMAIALDSNFTPEIMQKFVEQGSRIHNSPTWIAAASTLNSESLTVLLDNGLDPNTRFLGQKLTNLALSYGNIDNVELLRSRGHDLEEEFIIDDPLVIGGEGLRIVKLRDFVADISDIDRKNKILKYLDTIGL